MKVLLIEPGKRPRRVELEDSLDAKQKAVGGLIQAVYPFEDPVGLICNNKGKYLGLPLNRALYHPETGECYDVIAGTFLVCGLVEEDFDSLTDDLMQKYEERFRIPETFLRTKAGLLILPVMEEEPI